MPGTPSRGADLIGSPLVGAAAALGALISVNVGAGFAKQLFPTIGASGVTAVRILLAAAIVMLLRRPWRRSVPRQLLPSLVAYGLSLGLMNVLIYQAFARIPIAIAIGIEILGPLLIVLIGSRRRRDYLWLGLTMAGLLLLLPLRADDALDPLGLLFAGGAASCWALYIVFGKRVAGQLGGDAAAWGLLIATGLALPVGWLQAGPALFTPWVLLVGLAIALLSSAVPYTLEIEAMRRLPAPVFGILLSSSPAVAALVGFIVLGERLTSMQAVAILCIIVASAGSAVGCSRARNQ